MEETGKWLKSAKLEKREDTSTIWTEQVNTKSEAGQ
jgi:hypothetical protein